MGEILTRDEVDPDVLVPRWDAKGHLSVKKGSSYVALPTGPEQLRLRLTVMCNALAMIKLNRNELADISADLFEKCQDYLLWGLRLRATIRGVSRIHDPSVDASARL